jgi:hypothetical protein
MEMVGLGMEFSIGLGQVFHSTPTGCLIFQKDGPILCTPYGAQVHLFGMQTEEATDIEYCAVRKANSWQPDRCLHQHLLRRLRRYITCLPLSVQAELLVLLVMSGLLMCALAGRLQISSMLHTILPVYGSTTLQAASSSLAMYI